MVDENWVCFVKQRGHKSAFCHTHTVSDKRGFRQENRLRQAASASPTGQSFSRDVDQPSSAAPLRTRSIVDVIVARGVLLERVLRARRAYAIDAAVARAADLLEPDDRAANERARHRKRKIASFFGITL